MSNDDDSKIEFFHRIYKVISGIIGLGAIIWFSTVFDGYLVLIMVPFFGCACTFLLSSITELLTFKNYLLQEKIFSICSVIYILSFFSYFFGFIIAWDYFAFKHNAYSMALASIIFWIIAISSLIKVLKKK